MKRYIVASIVSVGFIAAVIAGTNNVQIKPKQELPDIKPEVIVNSDGKKEYRYNFSVEFNLPRCTRDYPSGIAPTPEGYAEDSISTTVVHCKKCSIGVYSEHDGEEGRSCTYCKAKENANE